MTTLRTFFGYAADLLLGQIPVIKFGEPFSFYADLPDPDIYRLPGFNTSVSFPTPRRCCAIGWRPSLPFLPQFTVTKPLGPEELRGAHRYGGPKLENGNLISGDSVGQCYTASGGVVDIGHVRDHADLARYLTVQAHLGLKEGRTIELPNEAGKRRIKFLRQGTAPDPRLCALIGARISYELAIWHEIVTWAAVKQIPLGEGQPYSAFSPEDNFSNLLGAYLGFRAILTVDTDFDEAMRRELSDALFLMGAFSAELTRLSVDYVEDHWFTYIDDKLVLLRRHFGAFPTVTPWHVTSLVIPGRDETRVALQKAILFNRTPISIAVPEVGLNGEPLEAYYTLEIEVDTKKIPSSWLNPVPSTVTPWWFGNLIDKVKADVLAQFPDGDKPD